MPVTTMSPSRKHKDDDDISESEPPSPKRNRSDAEEQYQQALKRIRELEEDIKKLREQGVESKNLLDGKFYATFDALWGVEESEFCESDFDMLVRTRRPSFCESGRISSGGMRQQQLHNSFSLTMKAAECDKYVANSDCGSQKSRTSHNSKASDEGHIWSCYVLEIPPVPPGTTLAGTVSGRTNIQGQEGSSNEDAFNSSAQVVPTTNEPEDAIVELDLPTSGPLSPREISHLVPAGRKNSSLYFDVAKWVFGLKETEPAKPFSFIQKLIHGATTAEVERDDDRSRGSTRKRLEHTGLKHMVCNKIRLWGERYYDIDPFILIVPILSTEQAREWKGEGYSAIFMIASNGTSLRTVAQSTLFTRRIELAKEPEIETARSLLVSILKGLAFSLRRMDQGKAPFLATDSDQCLNGEHWKEVSRLQEEFLKNNGQVKVPSKGSYDGVKVAKITFWAQGTTGGHPAPDPILLATKAGVNWSKFHDQQLLAGGEPKEDSDSDCTHDQSALAEQEYVEWARELQQERQRNQILGMTIGGELTDVQEKFPK